MGVKLELNKDITAQTVFNSRPDIVLVTPKAIRPQLCLAVGQGENVVWAEEVLDENHPASGKVAVIGSGNVGCEVAYHLSRQNIPVVVIGETDKAGSGLESRTATVLVKQLEDQGVQFRNGLKVKGIQEQRALCQDGQGHALVIEADTFVLAQPTESTTEFIEELEKQGLEVYPLPYCNQPGYALRAVRMGGSTARLC